MIPSHHRRSRRKARFSRFAGNGAVALLLATFICLASGSAFSTITTDVSAQQLIALESDGKADDTPDNQQACPNQLPLVAGARSEPPHRPASLRERDAITARAQGPPVVDCSFT